MKRDDLYTMAVDQFGVDLEETANKAQIIAALAENGVDWKMATTFDATAAALNEEDTVTTVVDVEQTEVDVKVPVNVITTETVAPPIVETYVVPAEEPEYDRPGAVVTTSSLKPKAPVFRPDVSVVVQDPDAKVLVKMIRDNATYMFRGYKFTKTHPFALVKASDVDDLIAHEDGFFVATPREVQEFYS